MNGVTFPGVFLPRLQVEGERKSPKAISARQRLPKPHRGEGERRGDIPLFNYRNH